MSDAPRTERLTGGNDLVEFVRVEPMLTRKGGSEWVKCRSPRGCAVAGHVFGLCRHSRED